MKHVTEEQVFAFVDESIAPSEERTIRAHLAGCSDCRTLLGEVRQLATDLAPEDAVDEDAHINRVMTAIAARRAALWTEIPSKRLGRWLPLVAGSVALVTGAMLFARSRDCYTSHGASTNRGAVSEISLAKDVGVHLFATEQQLALLKNGSVVASNVAFTAAYTNLRSAPAYLVLFAVDSAGELHWLYPAHNRARGNPASILLERSERERFLPTSVAMDGPASGRLRVVGITTDTPIHVLDIEKREASELQRWLLERDFHGAVTEMMLEVTTAR